jgi:hypothetical protein
VASTNPHFLNGKGRLHVHVRAPGARGGQLSSKLLEDALKEIRKNFTPSLGKDHGRVVLKAAKPHLEKKLMNFREELRAHQEKGMRGISCSHVR